jgi:hypothetical protein
MMIPFLWYKKLENLIARKYESVSSKSWRNAFNTSLLFFIAVTHHNIGGGAGAIRFDCCVIRGRRCPAAMYSVGHVIFLRQSQNADCWRGADDMIRASTYRQDERTPTSNHTDRGENLQNTLTK